MTLGSHQQSVGRDYVIAEDDEGRFRVFWCGGPAGSVLVGSAPSQAEAETIAEFDANVRRTLVRNEAEAAG